MIEKNLIVRLSLVMFLVLGLSACPLEYTSKLQGSKLTQGRLPGSAGHVRAQDYLISVMRPFADGLLSGSGNQSYMQRFSDGANILAIIPGTDLSDEYVMVGAHYDHLGGNCDSDVVSDVICNGATDNAAGVSIVMDVARLIREDSFSNRRSLVIALWDKEEQGLLGSQYFINNPVIPLNKIAAYVNFDIQGANILPALKGSSLIIASESGGNVLQTAVRNAASASPLEYRYLSAPFGHRQSDHTNFLAANVPSVFFTDAIGPCYHTAQDDIHIVDGVKLNQQAAVASTLVRNLLNRATAPSFQGSPVLHNDAQVMLDFASTAAQNRSRFGGYTQLFDSTLQSLQSVASKSANAFNGNDGNTTLQAAKNVISVFHNAGACEPFH